MAKANRKAPARRKAKAPAARKKGIRRVLITNDDGVSATGLKVLVSVLASAYEVYVLAPDRERSGVGHGFTLLDPLRCDPAPGALAEGLARSVYSASGTPVDCVKLALHTIFKEEKIDLVVSGINRGANLAIDTLYSGTVSAAMEAMMIGYPALAVSLVSRGRDSSTHEHFETAAQIALDFIQEHASEIAEQSGYMLNMNVPGLPRDEIKGIKITRVGRCHYTERYDIHKDPFGRPYFWLGGDLVIDGDQKDWDIVAVRENYVSVTPLAFDLTATPALKSLASWGGPLNKRR